MTRRKKFLISGAFAVIVLAVAAFFFLPGFLFDRTVWHSLHEQELSLEGPLRFSTQ